MGNSQRNQCVPKTDCKGVVIPTESSLFHGQVDALKPVDLQLFLEDLDVAEVERSIHNHVAEPVIPETIENPVQPKVNNLFQFEDPPESHISLIVTQRFRAAYVPSAERQLKESLNLKEAATATIQLRLKTTKERRAIRTTLKEHFLFNKLSDESIETIIDQMKHYCLNPGELIFKQGTVGQNFFIVATGHVEIVKNGKRVCYLAKGKSFGEVALLQDSARTATIRAVNRATLWGIGRAEFRHALQTVNAQEFNQNKFFIESVPLLKLLTPMQKENLVSLLVRQEFPAGSFIVREGESGDLLYLLKEGLVKIIKNNIVLRTLQKGDFFGEQALLYNTPRTASIQAQDHVVVLSLGRADLVRVLGDQLKSIMLKNSQVRALETSPTFNHLTSFQMEKLIERTTIKTYQPGEFLVRHGMMKGLKLWLLLSGTVVTSGFDKEFSTFECIGDRDLANSNAIYYSEDYMVTALSEVAEITKGDIESALGLSISTLSSRNSVLDVLKKVKIFKSLPSKSLEKIIVALQTRKFFAEDVIIEENAPGEEFFIVQEGEVDIYVEDVFVRTLGQNAYFGERSVLFNEKRTATVKAHDRCVCWVLGRKEFVSVVDEGMRRQLIRGINLQIDTAEMPDFEVLRIMSKGRFGNILLCMHSKNKQNYVIKEFNLKAVNELNLKDAVLAIKEILVHLDHPMIMKLVKSFEDESRIYFLEEYVCGPSLLEVLQVQKLLSVDNARFITACCLVILDYLHERQVMCRDLQPENLVFDEDGYPKLIDLDTAKVVQGRTYTVIDTPHYTAPEVIEGNGYGVAADYWSLGVVLYEMVYGMLPFGNNETDPYAIYQKIAQDQLGFPSMNECVGIVKQFLNKSPILRGDAKGLMKDEWFNKVKWGWLYSKVVKSPLSGVIQSTVSKQNTKYH